MVKQYILTVCLATFPHYVCKGYEAYLRIVCTSVNVERKYITERKVKKNFHKKIGTRNKGRAKLLGVKIVISITELVNKIEISCN